MITEINLYFTVPKVMVSFLCRDKMKYFFSHLIHHGYKNPKNSQLIIL
jgi:hypothetical protein